MLIILRKKVLLCFLPLFVATTSCAVVPTSKFVPTKLLDQNSNTNSYYYKPPVLPDNDVDIVVWRLTNDLKQTPPENKENQIIIAVLPEEGWEGTLRAWEGMSAPLVIIGGNVFPPNSIKHLYNGKVLGGGGVVIDVRFERDVKYNDGAPFVWISDIKIDPSNNNSQWFDFLRIGSTPGTSVELLANVVVQNIVHEGGAVSGFTADSGSKEPHSDWFQGANGPIWSLNVANSKINWAYQTFFMATGNDTKKIFYKGQSVNLHDVHLYSSPRSSWFKGPVYQFKTNKKGKFNFKKGLYYKFHFEDVYVVPDARYTSQSDSIFGPRSPGGKSTKRRGKKFYFPEYKNSEVAFSEGVFHGTLFYDVPKKEIVDFVQIDRHRTLSSLTDDEIRQKVRLLFSIK